MITESFENSVPLDVSSEFLNLDVFDFRVFLRDKIRENPNIKFNIVFDYVDKLTIRKAKAFLDDSRFNIESITVRATRKQYEEDINSFQSGIKWEEVK